MGSYVLDEYKLDFLGQKRFFPFSPENVLIGQKPEFNSSRSLYYILDGYKLQPPGPYPDWYKSYLYYKEVS